MTRAEHAEEAAWAIRTICGPACQVAPGTPCRNPDGTRRPDASPVHAARYTEAKAMAA